MYLAVIYYFFAAFFCIFYLFSDGFSDVATDIHYINTVADIYLAVMRSFEPFQFFIDRHALTVYAL